MAVSNIPVMTAVVIIILICVAIVLTIAEIFFHGKLGHAICVKIMETWGSRPGGTSGEVSSTIFGMRCDWMVS